MYVKENAKMAMKVKKGRRIARKIKVIVETVICDTRNDSEVDKPRAAREVDANETNGHRTNGIWTPTEEPRRKFRHMPTQKREKLGQ